MTTTRKPVHEAVAGGPSRAELVARAAALRPLVREHADRAEAERRVPDEVVDALTDVGLFRLFTPRRFGGYQAELRALVEVSEMLGEADGATAWQLGVQLVSSWLVCKFPPRAQDEVFGENPDARVCSALAPAATGRRVPGGWRVTGQWAYVSGSWHADWLCGGAMLGTTAGQPPEAAVILMPASALTVRDTWFTAGMRATASNTFGCEDVLVPEHRVLPIPALTGGGGPDTSGQEGLYHSPFNPVGVPALLAPLLGVSRAALAWTIEQAARKGISHATYSRQADAVNVQVQIAQAALKIETARLHVYRGVDQVDSSARQDSYLEYEARAMIRAEAGYVAQQLLDAISILLNVHGAGSMADGNPLQRYWRDISTAARHAGLNSAVGYEILGKTLLGVPERIAAWT